MYFELSRFILSRTPCDIFFCIGQVTSTASNTETTEDATFTVSNSVTPLRTESGNSSILIGTILAAVLFTLLTTFIVVFIKRRRASKKGMQHAQVSYIVNFKRLYNFRLYNTNGILWYL